MMKGMGREAGKITPLARRLAEEHGVDWKQITGTGRGGTVQERDILSALARKLEQTGFAPAQSGETPPAPKPQPALPEDFPRGDLGEAEGSPTPRPEPPRTYRAGRWGRAVSLAAVREARAALAEAWPIEQEVYHWFLRSAWLAARETLGPAVSVRQAEAEGGGGREVPAAFSLRGMIAALGSTPWGSGGILVWRARPEAPGPESRGHLWIEEGLGEWGLLSLEGLFDSERAGRLLFKLAHYLEHPILLV